jgi:hypothetical protein
MSRVGNLFFYFLDGTVSVLKSVTGLSFFILLFLFSKRAPVFATGVFILTILILVSVIMTRTYLKWAGNKTRGNLLSFIYSTTKESSASSLIIFSVSAVIIVAVKTMAEVYLF